MSLSQFFSSFFVLPGPVAGVLGPILKSIAEVWGLTWWLFLPLIAAFILWDAWLLYLHVRFLKGIKWVVLEIKVPKNILKTPKAMEQIFATAHTPYSYGFSKYQKYIQGADEKFMSFELVGRAGETHFYLRVPAELRNLMESAIFAQYPEAEVVEVEDYLHELPHVLPNEQIDVGGFEMVFGKPDFFPLRTYPSFEEPVEEQRIDPIAQLIESMSKMQGDQQFWFQLVTVPTGTAWVEKGEEEINKMHGIVKEEHHKGGFFPKIDLGISLGEAIAAPFRHPAEAHGTKHEEKPVKPQKLMLSSIEKARADGITEKIGKFGLQTTVRFMFLNRKGEQPPVDRNMSFAFGYIRQFNTQDLNNLKPSKEYNSAGFTVKGLFKKIRLNYKKRIMYERYTHVAHNHHAPILNIEELATLYHFPITAVSSTQLEKIESKKGAPPATLPIFEEDEPGENEESTVTQSSHGH